MTEERKAPAIRFKEFLDDVWKKRKLEECTEISAGGDIDKSKLLNNGEYPVIANALTNDGIIGYYNDSFRIEAPAVTVTGRGNVGVAKARNVNFTPVVRLLSLKSDYDVIFLENAINTQNIVIESTGVPQLTVPQLGSYKIFFPSLPEQRAIGSFFQDLDKLITLQQRKLEKSRRIKKSMLQKMFPEKKQTVPAIRFKEFLDDVWKKRKLEEVAEITMGQSPNSENYTDNPSDYILVQGNADMKDGKVFPRVWTTQVTKQGKEGDLILSVRAPVGDIGKTDYNVVLGRGVAAIRGNEFIFQTLSKMKQNGYWNNLSTGSTFESINSNDIKSATIPLPSPPEQKVIGSFFQDIDKFIALQQRRLDKLQNMKKALLEQMMM